MRRRAYLTLLGVVAPLALATPAWAYWSAGGTGTGTAVTATLNSPTNLTANATAGSHNVQLAWNASTLSTGQPSTGYYATRIRTSDGAAAAACGTTPATPTTATTCGDAGVADGSYRYVVTAAYRTWTAASAASNTVTVSTVTADTTAPTVTVTEVTPAPNANGYNQTNPVTVKLSATDNTGGSGVASITYTLDGGAPVTTTGTTAAVVVSGQGTHAVTYFATDNAANNSATGSQTIKIDTVAPTVTVNQAAGQTDPTTGSTVNFTATFSEPVTGLTGTGVTLSGTAAATTATVTGNGTTYNIAVTGMTKTGTIVATIGAGKAQDAAGNNNTTSTSTNNTVTYNDTTAPIVIITNFVANSGHTATISGNAGSTPGDATTVTVVLCTSSTFPCSAPNTKATLTATVNAGVWTVTSGNLGNGTIVWARATQTDLSGNTGNSAGGTPVTT